MKYFFPVHSSWAEHHPKDPNEGLFLLLTIKDGILIVEKEEDAQSIRHLLSEYGQSLIKERIYFPDDDKERPTFTFLVQMDPFDLIRENLERSVAESVQGYDNTLLIAPENQESIVTEEKYWLIEGNLAIIKLAVEILQKEGFNNLQLGQMVLEFIREFRTMLQTGLQTVLETFLEIIEAILVRLIFGYDKSIRLLANAVAKLEWVAEIAPEQLLGVPFELFTRIFELKKQEPQQKVVQLLDEIMKVEWEYLVSFTKFVQVNPSADLVALTINYESLTIFGRSAHKGGEVLAPMLGWFVLALNELLQEIYQYDERLKQAIYRKGAIITMDLENFSFTLFSKKHKMELQLQLLAFAKEAMPLLYGIVGNGKSVGISREMERRLEGILKKYFQLEVEEPKPLPQVPQISQDLSFSIMAQNVYQVARAIFVTEGVTEHEQEVMTQILSFASKNEYLHGRIEKIPNLMMAMAKCSTNLETNVLVVFESLFAKFKEDVFNLNRRIKDQIMMVITTKENRFNRLKQQQTEHIVPILIEIGKEEHWTIQLAEEPVRKNEKTQVLREFMEYVLTTSHRQKAKNITAIIEKQLASPIQDDRGITLGKKLTRKSAFLEILYFYLFDDESRSVLGNEVPEKFGPLIQRNIAIIKILFDKLFEKKQVQIVRERLRGELNYLDMIGIKFEQKLVRIYSLFLLGSLFLISESEKKAIDYYMACKELVDWFRKHGDELPVFQILDPIISKYPLPTVSQLKYVIDELFHYPTSELFTYSKSFITSIGDLKGSSMIILYKNERVVFRATTDAEKQLLYTSLLENFLKSLEDLMQEVHDPTDHVEHVILQGGAIYSTIKEQFRFNLFRTIRGSTDMLLFKKFVEESLNILKKEDPLSDPLSPETLEQLTQLFSSLF